MTEKIQRAVEEFLAASDRREFDRIEFFQRLGLLVRPVFPEDERRSPLLIYDGSEGTVVPPIRIGLGFVVYDEVLPQYFEMRNHLTLDPIKGWQIVRLPDIVVTSTGWLVKEKGSIDGRAHTNIYWRFRRHHVKSQVAISCGDFRFINTYSIKFCYIDCMKKQIVIIHGGDTFATQEEYLNFLRNYEINIERYKTDKDDWKPWLRKMLGDEYEVILPLIPNKTNARFEEWKLWFEKFISFLNDGVVLVGHSQGGIFLAKYLSENPFPKKITAVMLVAAPYDKDCDGHPVLSFSLPTTLNMQTDNVFLYQSKDDPVVPFSALEYYQKALPNAQVRVFEDRGHLNQEEFPELLEDIRNLDK